jgi:hypothetical protein
MIDRNHLLDPSVPENLQRVRDLHPDASAPVAAPDFAGLPPASKLCADAVVTGLRAMDSCSAAGPDLLTSRILKLVLDDASGSLPGCTGGEILCAVAHIFTDGDMPVDNMPSFSAATVLATPRPAGGVRPLAIGMTLRRLISSAVLQHVTPCVTPAACEYLTPHQVAVGVKSACDLIFHEVRAALDENVANDEYVLVLVDARNAINVVKRAKMLDAVVQHVPALARLAYAVYGQPPLLRAGECIFESLEGTASALRPSNASL